jgi:hypothetical protein
MGETLTETPAMATMLDRLNRLSLSNRHDAYDDVAWDEPGYEVWNIEGLLDTPRHDPLFDTAWYRARSDADKARFACYRAASQMKVGWQFENILQQGLLRMATDQENGSKAFRYLHHEIIEESQHTLMFQEFVDRSGLPVRGMGQPWRAIGRPLTLAHRWPEPAFFFTFVLGGEEPVDHMQRLWLKQGIGHPLIERIVKIHVAEEARHISFARHYLGQQVPKMNVVARRALAIHAPLTLAVMASIMLEPAPDVRRHVGLPDEVVRDAFRTDKGRVLRAQSVAKIQRLWEDLDLMTATSVRLWKKVGLWTEPSA